jgi:antitoxin (DNA-binding transcriptional repressor) of toxin-antitoxin stability system
LTLASDWRTVGFVESTISSAFLRRQAGACLSRVSQGDTFVVLRHGHPVAVLRPPRTKEMARRRAATFLWRNLGELMAAARRGPVLITYYGDGMAILEPVSARLEVER